MFSTFPSLEDLEKIASHTPEYMRPNRIPFAVILEGFISPEDCDNIAKVGMTYAPYTSSHCNAETREIPYIPCLEGVKNAALTANEMFWRYDLDETPMSWMQTYRHASSYQLHADAAPGQMRKLTAVALLTSSDNYVEGDLVIQFHPESFVVPRTQGTIVIFQANLLHEVMFVVSGLRQTINMGFWGPPFR